MSRIQSDMRPGVVDAATKTVCVDLDCRRCGYNLRTLAESGRCPECGSPVGLSTRGNFLQFANPEWAGKVAKGLQIIFAMIIVTILVQLGAGCAGAQTYILPIMLAAGIAAADFYGVWLLTEPDPSGIGEEKNIPARKVLRVAALIALIGTAIETGITLFSGGVDSVVETVLTVLMTIAALGGLVAWYVKYEYFAIIARRIPDDELAARSLTIRKWIIIGVLVGIIGGILTAAMSAGAGPGMSVGLILLIPAGIVILVFSIMTFVLIYRIQKAVVAEAELAKLNWSTAMREFKTPVANSTS